MKLLEILFPPRLPKVEYFQQACVSGQQDPFYRPLDEDGIGEKRRKKYADALERIQAEGLS